MSEKTIPENVKSFVAKQILHYLDEDPDKALPNLLSWADKFDKDNLFPSQRAAFHKVIDNPDNNWYRLIKSLWTDLDAGVRKTFFENFIVNVNLIGFARQEKAEKEHGCNIPWAILMDPTSACNLHCTGCWAADYGNKLNMSYETLDDIVRQGTELGTFLYIFSGGEPMVRKTDILKLCQAHPDCMFLAFTNGTLIDEDFADGMLRVKNFVPAISIEGFEEATDGRRGHGTYQAVVKTMRLLQSKKLPFGVSCCYTSQNIDSLSSEEFFDSLIADGAKFAWFFHYMPVGNDAVTQLLPSPEQRKKMYDRIRAYRSTKPIFTIDFQTTGSMWAGASPGDGGTSTSTPTGTWSPALLSTTPIPASMTRRCWRLSSPRCSWPITTASPLTRTCSAPAPCWRTLASSRRWWKRAGPGPRTCSPPSPWKT